MSHFTSTMIDDEDLIEELRRYGEKNLPTLPAPGARITKRSNALTDQNREIYLKKLNHYKAREKAEQNPSKYLKQQAANNTTVNANTNDTTIAASTQPPAPVSAIASSSKPKNSRRSSARFELKNNVYYENDDRDEPEEEDVVEIDSPNDVTSEYVKVSNAFTSPMSTSGFNNTTNNNTNYGDDDNSDNNEDFASRYNGDYHTAHSIISSTQLHPQPSSSGTRKTGTLLFIFLNLNLTILTHG
jgi:hypothetical protein